VTEVLVPGEVEQRKRQQREAAGVAIPDETWRQLRETAGKLGVLLEDV
jgi:LDH2 family malate/lactate/ureidoglycolate dehydrogenase